MRIVHRLNSAPHITIRGERGAFHIFSGEKLVDRRKTFAGAIGAAVGQAADERGAPTIEEIPVEGGANA